MTAHKAAATYWRLLDRQPTQALAVRREAEQAFGRESFERALISAKENTK